MNSKTHQYHFRPTYLRWYFIVSTLALLSMLSPAQAQLLDVPAGVLSNVEHTGKARIIVILKMPEQPDGELAGAMAVDLETQIKERQQQFIDGFSRTREGDRTDVSGTLDASKMIQFRTIPAVAMEADAKTLSQIQESPFVKNVVEDAVYKPTLSDSIPLIGADSVWLEGYSGAGQTVAILDTGVDGAHPDLAGKVVAEACFSTASTGHNATSVCPNGTQEQIGSGAGVACDSGVSGCSHGTHVAGIVAANGSVQGVAKDANIIAIQVFSRFDNSSLCLNSPCALSFTSAQILALEHVLGLQNSMQIAAVNMSLGGGNYSDVCTSFLINEIKKPIDDLRSAGIATIAASGNDGYKNGIASPACISSAISVGATTKSDTVASYSNSADILDLLAPGSYIESTLPNGTNGRKSGTSMATPHVAGAFALLKSAAPDASVDDIFRVLKVTGKRIEDSRIGIPNPPRITPRINLKKALERLVPDEPPVETPEISVTPTSHDFGNVEIGQSSSVTVTISNTGDVDLEIGQISLSSGDFSISSDNCSNTTVVAGGNCTVTITFNPQTEGAKSATLSIASNDPDTPTVEITLNGNGIVDVAGPTPASPCKVYAVHDQGRNKSQIFTIGLNAPHDVNRLGPLYSGYDLESIAIQPTSNIIYVASGEDVATGQKKGAVYTVDSTTGDLALVCNTGFNEIEDLAFSADGVLWAWAKGDGLVTIDLTAITPDPTTGEPTCETNLVIPSNAPVEGLTLKEDGGEITFYGAVNTSLELWEYNSSTSHLEVCSLPSETEALEMMSDGNLLFGTHNDSSFSIHAFNPGTCNDLVDRDIPTGRYNDVEGIALSAEECVR